MATEPITGRVANVNDNGFKLEGADAWINYSKGGEGWQGYVGPKPLRVGQKVEVECAESNGRWYASKGKVLVTAPGSAAEPSPAPSPAGPAPTYQATHDEDQARVAQERDPSDERLPQGFPEPEVGSYAFRDLSIMRQNRLNVAVQALVANLENSRQEDKHFRMITPFSIIEFEQLLVEGAVADAKARENEGGAG